MANLKIDYITAHDPLNVNTWSGLNFFIMKALEAQGATINIITRLYAKPDFGLKWRYHWYRWKGKNYQYERTPCYTRQFGEQVNSQLSADADLILSTSTAALPFIKTSKPIFLYTDATFDNLAEYYDHFSKLPKASKQVADELEKKAYDKCSKLLFASEWAADSAKSFYGVPSSKINVIPFGANLEKVPEPGLIHRQIDEKSTAEIVFLFVGIEFERKGGRKAIEIVERLNASGIDARLIMVGMNDLKDKPLPSFVEKHGFLNKNLPNENEQLALLYARAHFFLLPVQKECYGVVFVEANAFGLPCLTTDISGIKTIIKNGVNGLKFDVAAPVEVYVSKIKEILDNKETYKALAHSARSEYDNRLNWGLAGKKIKELFAKL